MLLPPHVRLFLSNHAVRSAFSVETFTVFLSTFRGLDGLFTPFSYVNAQLKTMYHPNWAYNVFIDSQNFGESEQNAP